MAKITDIDAADTVRTVEAEIGATVMETAVRNAIPGIEGECGGACACATCHVHVSEACTDKVGEAAPMEQDMLDLAFDVRPNSRLCCQIKVTQELDGLVVRTPERQGWAGRAARGFRRQALRGAGATHGRRPINTDVAIIGAGPVGLFAVFELGLLDILSASKSSSRPSTNGCVLCNRDAMQLMRNTCRLPALIVADRQPYP